MILDDEDPILLNYKRKLDSLEKIVSSEPTSRNYYQLASHIHQNAISQDDLKRVEQLFQSILFILFGKN